MRIKLEVLKKRETITKNKHRIRDNNKAMGQEHGERQQQVASTEKKLETKTGINPEAKTKRTPKIHLLKALIIYKKQYRISKMVHISFPALSTNT